jgi:hypothetical protein
MSRASMAFMMYHGCCCAIVQAVVVISKGEGEKEKWQNRLWRRRQRASSRGMKEEAARTQCGLKAVKLPAYNCDLHPSYGRKESLITESVNDMEARYLQHSHQKTSVYNHLCYRPIFRLCFIPFCYVSHMF